MPSTAIITGASGGLGVALAKAFFLCGYSLILLTRTPITNREELLKLEKDRENNQKILNICCDLSDTAELLQTCEKIRANVEAVDVLINNAAVHGAIGPLIENKLDDWEKALAVNFLAPVFLCKEIIPLLEKTSGSIINISGGGAVSYRENFLAYSCSKAALQRFSENLANDLAPKGVTVNSIAPGPMPTGLMTEILNSAADVAGKKEIDNAKKVFESEEDPFSKVTELCLYLASPASRHISGRLISALWDKWREWEDHIKEFKNHDVYKVRRIVSRDYGFDWGDV